MKELTDHIVSWLRAAGLEVRERELGETFLPGVTIEAGALLLDCDRLLYPGDLLHEAGHIAVIPAARRADFSGDLGTDASEVEVICWSYAAALACGLDPAIVFHPHGYQGKAAGLLNTFSLGVYPGAAGLVRMGLCGQGEYPRLRRWLRE